MVRRRQAEGGGGRIALEPLTLVEGLCTIMDEILVNALDARVRDETTTTLEAALPVAAAQQDVPMPLELLTSHHEALSECMRQLRPYPHDIPPSADAAERKQPLSLQPNRQREA